MKFRPYPEYMDSGMPWLGEVPKGWQIKPNRALFQEIREANHPNEEMLSVTITKGVIRQSELLSETSKKDSSNVDKSKYKLVTPGELVYNKMRAWQGAIGLSRYRGIVSPAYIVERPRKEIIGEYAHYLFRTPRFAKEAERWSYGITSDQWSLRPEHFKAIYTCVPPRNEQTQIALFLEWKTAQIDRFIRAKRQLIERLKEQKQVLINQAVTGAIDVRTGKPYPEYKDSGVPWLGKVPAGWEVLPVRRCAKKVKTGGTPAGAGDEYFDSIGFNWFTPGDFTDDLYLSESERRLSEIGKKEVQVFPQNTVMMIGIGATIGKVAISRYMASCNQQINAIIPNEKVVAEYMALSLSVLRDFIISCGSYTTMPIINQEETKSLRIPVPSLPEQKDIVSHILGKCAVIDQSITRTQREIDLIQEYRTRLIADVVTGKLDVRGVEVPEVDQSEEAMDEAVISDDAVTQDKLEAAM